LYESGTDIEALIKYKNLCVMKDYRKPEDRRKFLVDAVNRNIIIERLAAVKSDAEMKAMKEESELIDELMECIRKNDDSVNLRLRRKMRLKKLL